MTNLKLLKTLTAMVESIHTDCTRGVELQLSPRTDDHLAEFEVIRARLWATVCRAIRLSDEVDSRGGLADANQAIIDEIRLIHDGMVVEGHGHD